MEEQLAMDLEELEEEVKGAESKVIEAVEGEVIEGLAMLQEQVARLQAELSQSVERVAGLLRGREDVVPELIGGASMAELEASFPVAQEAFRRLAGRMGPVSRGGGSRSEGFSAGLSSQPTAFELLAAAVARKG